MLEFSPLNKTWIFDADGTIVKHNGYLIDGYDTLLDGVKEFWLRLNPNDSVIILTSRKEEAVESLKECLRNNNLRYDHLLCNLPMGERILVNDKKPSGLKTAYSIDKERDEKLVVDYVINDEL